MKSNPFILPLWLALGIALGVSLSVDIAFDTFWGLLAWIPWLVTVGLAVSWDRRRP